MTMWKQNAKIYLLPILIFGLLSTFACKTSSLVSIQQISGTWQEKEPTDVMQFAGSGHYIKFSDNNTFQLEQNLWTDMLDPKSPCRANRTDYIKGFYKLKGSTLKLTGTYCEDNTFATTKANCKNESEFKKTYQIEINSDGERIILDKNEVEPGMQILLIKQ